MTRFRVVATVLGAVLAWGGIGRAQNSIDALEDELRDVRQQHQEATAQNLSNFFGQVDPAMTDPAAAVALYQKAGGAMPAPTPVKSEHDNETTEEREARLALDRANAAPLSEILELHCGLLHYAALFVTKPKQEGLQEDFNGWLQKAAQLYPEACAMPPPPSTTPEDTNPSPRHRHDADGEAKKAPPPFDISGLKNTAMRDSVIAKFLGFRGWDDKDEGGWAVRDIPRLYRTNILEPLRAKPTDATLAAWDVSIAMASADEPDRSKWTTSDYPPLAFDRACDDYAAAPDTEKIEAIIQIVRANPTHPQSEEWQARAHQLIEAYKVAHGGRTSDEAGAAITSNIPATNSNVTVTTQQVGDATIVTTRTNAVSSVPPPPAR